MTGLRTLGRGPPSADAGGIFAGASDPDCGAAAVKTGGVERIRERCWRFRKRAGETLGSRELVGRCLRRKLINYFFFFFLSTKLSGKEEKLQIMITVGGGGGRGFSCLGRVRRSGGLD